MKKLLLLLILILVLAACNATESASPAAQSSFEYVDEPIPPVLNLASTTITDECSEADTASPTTRSYTQAENTLVEDIDYYAIFCTDAGAILIDLYESETPITVNNLVFLANHEYYNNTIFHRVIEGFMAQAGDPTGTGSGGPGYQFADEIVQGLEFNRRGLLAMANAGAGTNGSQFFITFAEAPHLNGKHTIFGEVVEGTRVLNGILRRDPSDAQAPSTTLRTILIFQSATSE